MSKGFVVLDWANVRLVATHLESCPSKSDVRRAQIQEIREVLHETQSLSTLWAGDFNFDLRFEGSVYGLPSAAKSTLPSHKDKLFDGVLSFEANVLTSQVFHVGSSDHWPVLSHVLLPKR